MASRRAPAELSPKDLRRFRAAKQLALDWMQAMRSSSRGLADLLGEHPSYISRFLHPDEFHAPTERRPAMMRVQEKIERLCSYKHDIAEVPLEQYEVDRDDAALVARNLIYRLRVLRKELDPAQALVYVAEPCEIALRARRAYRAVMCTNVLLTINILVLDDRARIASRELLERTLQRVDALEGAALDSLPEAPPDFPPQRAMGHAACARARLGLLLRDASLVKIGVGGMIRAALMPHPPKMGLWDNLLGFAEGLLEEGYPEAEKLSKDIISRAAADRSDSLRHALETRRLPRLLSIWRKTDARSFSEVLQD